MRQSRLTETKIVSTRTQLEMAFPSRSPNCGNVPVRVLSGLSSRMIIEKGTLNLVPWWAAFERGSKILHSGEQGVR